MRGFLLDTNVISLLSPAMQAMVIASGHSPGMADALIAGTAKALDLAVITRNERHFQPFGIETYSPEIVTSIPD